MAVVGNLELVVATKAQLQKALVDSGLSYEQPPEQDVEGVWQKLEEAGLLQEVRVEVELAVAVDFKET